MTYVQLENDFMSRENNPYLVPIEPDTIEAFHANNIKNLCKEMAFAWLKRNALYIGNRNMVHDTQENYHESIFLYSRTLT